VDSLNSPPAPDWLGGSPVRCTLLAHVICQTGAGRDLGYDPAQVPPAAPSAEAGQPPTPLESGCTEDVVAVPLDP
jgi:hypothetical protein